MLRREITRDEYLRLACSMAGESVDFFPDDPLSTLASSDGVFYVVTFETMAERNSYAEEFNKRLVRYLRKRTSYRGPIHLVDLREGKR